MRVSEVVSLKVSDVDSKRMMLRVEQGKGRKEPRGGCALSGGGFAMSGRSSVTSKKNRSAVTVLLIFGVLAPLDVRCSWKRRTSSLLAVLGERPRNAAKAFTLRM
jgi:integrase